MPSKMLPAHAGSIAEAAKNIPDVGGLIGWFTSKEKVFPRMSEAFPCERVQRTELPKTLPAAQVRRWRVAGA